MASTYLTRTLGAATNRKKFTISFWMKRSGLGQQYVWQSFYSSNFGYRLGIYFDSTDEFVIKGVDGGSTHTLLKTNRKLRDTNGWYHCYFAFDSTQGTASDRVKIYINGVQETSFSTGTYPNQNTDFAVGVDGSINYLLQSGKYGGGSSNYFDGSMSHFHYVDGSVIAHTQFGSTDSTTGEWKINTSPTISSYGTAGFLILKDGNSVTDQSGNSNNFTVGGGTLTKTEDCPSNVFATMNPLWKPMTDQTYSFDNANSRVYANSNTDWLRSNATMGAKTGKWWYEVYLGTANNENRIGWDSIDHSNETNQNYYSGLNVSNGSSNGDVRGGIRGTSSYSPNAIQLPADGGGNATWTQGDYLGMGIDLDNQTITIHKNGSALATNWSYAGYSGTSVLKSRGFFIGASANWYSGSGNQNIYDFNFGNGSFNGNNLTGTTYTDSNSQGVFKYQPPTNYLAWCTKNLNV